MNKGDRFVVLLFALGPALAVLAVGMAFGGYMAFGTGSPTLGFLCLLPFVYLARALLP